MAWRKMKYLVDLSRMRDTNDVDEKIEPKDNFHVELPENKKAMKILSRQVFNALTKPVVLGAIKECKFEESLMEKAMQMCGLRDPENYAAIYAKSKWAKGGDAWLDLTEFQAIIERFAEPDRLLEKMLRKSNQIMAEKDLQYVYTLDEFQWTENIDCRCNVTPTENIPMMTLAKEKAERHEKWDELLQNLEKL